MSAADSNRAIEAIWRLEQPKLIAGLVRMVRDVALAEDLAQDALVAALQAWPETGAPDRPGAWLMAAAKRRAIDLLRRDQMLARKHAALQHALDAGLQDAELAVSVAKAKAGDAALDATAAMIQYHGGIGYTWEHEAHFFYKRAKRLAGQYGDVAVHRERIATLTV